MGIRLYNSDVEQDLTVLEDLSLKNYPFAYALFPDDLMAGQLLVDAVGRMVRSVDNREELFLRDIDLLFFKHMSTIAFLRDKHFSPTDEVKEKEPFYRLSLKERAVLFLKEKRGLSLTKIAEACAMKSDEVFRLLSTGREGLS